VRVTDAGIATSGRAGRRWAGGHHLVDPRTGRPAPGGPDAVSVVAATALAAEVLAKLVALRGLAEGVPLAMARGAERVRSAILQEPAA